MRIRCRNSVVPFLAAALLVPAPASPAQAQQQPLRLTLQDAIHKALQANLSVLVGATRVEEAEGTRARRESAALLPRIGVESYANAQNRDLRAFGLSLPGVPIPSVVGPFSNYDFRVYAQQNIVDLESYRNLKASGRAIESSAPLPVSTSTPNPLRPTRLLQHRASPTPPPC
jgi:outer membrane protein TolC